MTRSSLLVTILNNPSGILALTLTDWALLISQARSANLLSRLYSLLSTEDLIESVPEQPLNHLRSADRQAQTQHRQVLWEIERIASALAGLDIAPVILKGGAYIYSKNAASAGRTVGDVDILVPKTLLPEVEKRLLVEGFLATKVDDYDIKYYREWAHEIPPLKHFKRGTTLDVHHNILPTLKRQLDPELLFSASVADAHGIAVLQHHDMIIHSAAHLFLEGEFDSGLRDLSDLHLLLSALSSPQDWQGLVTRAQQLGLLYPVYLACRYSQKIYHTDVPAGLFNADHLAADIPRGWRLRVLDALFNKVLVPHHPSCEGIGFKLSSFVLYIRGHLVKMPLRILLPHLLKKALRPKEQDESQQTMMN